MDNIKYNAAIKLYKSLKTPNNKLNVLRDRQLEPKAVKDLFKTITDNHYIEKITGGEYNNVFYRGRRWHYCYIDDTGTGGLI